MQHKLQHLLCPVGQSLDFVTPARQAGWSKAFVCQPDEVLLGAAVLQLGYQYLPVRLMLWEGDSASLLTHLVHDMTCVPYLEQYLVLEGAPVEVLAQLQRELAAVRGRRLRAGTYSDYLAWLAHRLGPLARIAPHNPVRLLTEPLLCVSATPRPTEAVEAVGDFQRSAIKLSFELGQFGEQVFGTLFAHAHGYRNLHGVQDQKAYQSAGIDAIVRTSHGPTTYDSKAEQYKVNLSLELSGNYEAGTPGWLLTSQMANLCTVFRPTGDAFIVDFSAVKQWALDPASSLPMRLGKAAGQKYRSQVYLAHHAAMLAAVPSVHLRIQDWLPEVYGAEVFTETSEVSAATLARYSLTPQSPLC